MSSSTVSGIGLVKIITLTLALTVSFNANANPSLEKIGRFESRAWWNKAVLRDSQTTAPAVILLPGSGPLGPEGMVPPHVTSTGTAVPLLCQFAEALHSAGIHTLSLGKPGIESVKSWDLKNSFYNQALYSQLRWKDLMNNLDEAVAFVKKQPGVDPRKIYVLGHSEGTQVAIDYAATVGSDLAGLIFLGYTGDDMKTTLDWQFYRRSIEHFISTDVDSDQDGFITQKDAASWPEFKWNWNDHSERLSYEEIEKRLRAEPSLQAQIASVEKLPLYQDGIYARGELHSIAASLKLPIYAYTGSLDLQTPPAHLERLKAACARANKENCHIVIIPGLGHGFSPPREPRSHPFLDITLGPVDPNFKEVLMKLGKDLVGID